MQRCDRSFPQLLARRIACTGILCAVAMTVSSCATLGERRGEDPLTVLVAWHEALQAGQPEVAWELLSPEAREGLGKEAFVSMYDAQAPALIERARVMLAWARSHPPAEEAVVDVGARRVHLVWTRTGWRIDGGADGSHAGEAPSD